MGTIPFKSPEWLDAVARHKGGAGSASGGSEPPKRGNKYGAQAVETEEGRFDSKAEYARWNELRAMERAGEITDLQRQVPFPCEVNGVLVCRYVADYTYTRAGVYVVEDCKSEPTRKNAAYRLKKRLVESLYPFTITEHLRGR